MERTNSRTPAGNYSIDAVARTSVRLFPRLDPRRNNVGRRFSTVT